MKATATLACALPLMLALAGCAAPPLTLYTLTDKAPARLAASLGPGVRVFTVARVAIPSDLDNDDILVRNGNVLRRSMKGRWASRLSLEITALMTDQLAERNPDSWFTDTQLFDYPADRIEISISRLDVTTDGRAMLQADWLILPHDPGKPIQRDRASFSLTAPTATDHDVVSLETELVKDLSDAIRLP